VTSDDRIDRLFAALEAIGAPRPRPPESDAALAELEAELEPLKLPDRLRRLWQRVDAGTMPLQAFPQLSNPEFALFGWRMARDEEFGTPENLLAFCYESHFHLLVELDDGEQPGGTVFRYAFTDDAMTMSCPHLDDWLDALTQILEEGAYERGEGAYGSWIRANQERYEELCRERLAASRPHPIHGDERAIPLDARSWPERWQRAIAPFRHAQEPRGPDGTVRELLAAARRGEARATVAGVQTTLAVGRPQEPWRILFADETGVLDVLCRPEVPGLGLLGQTHRVELDVHAHHIRGPRPMMDWRALGKPRLHDLIRHAAPQAVAEAIRRLPEDP
jgi:hypothetical protein